jgi:hypothetical protein
MKTILQAIEEHLIGFVLALIAVVVLVVLGTEVLHDIRGDSCRDAIVPIGTVDATKCPSPKQSADIGTIDHRTVMVCRCPGVRVEIGSDSRDGGTP